MTAGVKYVAHSSNGYSEGMTQSVPDLKTATEGGM